MKQICHRQWEVGCNQCPTYHKAESQPYGEAISPSFGNDTSDHKTEDFSNDGSVTETSLPGSGDLVGSIRCQMAIFLGECC